MNRVLTYIVGVLLFMMVIVITIQISIRALLPKIGIIVHAPWTEELPRYFLLWFIFLGASVGARAGDLIAVEALLDVLRPRARRILVCFALLTTIVFFCVLIWYGLRWASFGGTETSAAMGIPMSWAYMSLPVGCACAALSVVARLIEHVSMPEAADEPDSSPTVCTENFQ